MNRILALPVCIALAACGSSSDEAEVSIGLTGVLPAGTEVTAEFDSVTTTSSLSTTNVGSYRWAVGEIDGSTAGFAAVTVDGAIGAPPSSNVTFNGGYSYSDLVNGSSVGSGSGPASLDFDFAAGTLTGNFGGIDIAGVVSGNDVGGTATRAGITGDLDGFISTDGAIGAFAGDNGTDGFVGGFNVE